MIRAAAARTLTRGVAGSAPPTPLLTPTTATTVALATTTATCNISTRALHLRGLASAGATARRGSNTAAGSPHRTLVSGIGIGAPRPQQQTRTQPHQQRPHLQQPSNAMAKSTAKRPRSDAARVAGASATDAAAATPNGGGAATAALASGMLEYINYAWTPYHAVEEGSRRLLKAGFQHISETGAWADLKPGGKYFFTRNYSTLVAFAVGQKFKPGNGFYMVGAHTDSPCLKLKPVTKSVKAGWHLVNVETYGGGLWSTWFDRDLGIAGRVLVRSKGDDGVERIVHRLVKVDRPLLRIPMLAIHLNRTINTDGFKFNTQTNLAPVLATAAKAQLGLDAKADPPAAAGSEAAKHHAQLLDLLATELGIAVSDIVDFELNLCDVQPGVLGGINSEFVFVGRLDNLCMSYLALQSLADACAGDNALAEETGVRAIALFDHEEVGSDSAQGAGSPVMRDTITRVARVLSGGEADAPERSLRNSFLVSADMAHALHPNYQDKHDSEHQPRFHEGLVLKHNANQRYATNAVSAALFREVGKRRGVPCQEFCVRNDMPCGSTIGPILASALGCRTVDVGIAQLSMHSIREMCGTDDVGLAYRHFVAFFEDFGALDATLDIDALPPPNVLGTLNDVPCEHTGHGGAPREPPHPGLAKPSK